MNIMNTMVRSAVAGFGREFGRAGANAILKGKNHIAIKDYSGRIKPSDSEVIKAIKQIEKTEFVTTNKGGDYVDYLTNVSRLITVTDLAIDNIKFNGKETLNEIDTIFHMLSLYQDKFNHGSHLIDSDFSDKSKDYLNAKTKELSETFDKFFNKAKDYVNSNLEECKKQRPGKIGLALAQIFSFSLVGAAISLPLLLIAAMIEFDYTLYVTPATILTTLSVVLYKQFSMSEEEYLIDTVEEYSYFKQFEYLRNTKVSLKLN